MFTAEMARQQQADDLDERIQYAVANRRQGNGAYMRVYSEDPFLHTLHEELEKRGFTNVNVPDVILSGDAYFEW